MKSNGRYVRLDFRVVGSLHGQLIERTLELLEVSCLQRRALHERLLSLLYHGVLLSLRMKIIHVYTICAQQVMGPPHTVVKA
jgi:hypothetical protein